MLNSENEMSDATILNTATMGTTISENLPPASTKLETASETKLNEPQTLTIISLNITAPGTKLENTSNVNIGDRVDIDTRESMETILSGTTLSDTTASDAKSDTESHETSIFTSTTENINTPEASVFDTLALDTSERVNVKQESTSTDMTTPGGELFDSATVDTSKTEIVDIFNTGSNKLVGIFNTELGRTTQGTKVPDSKANSTLLDTVCTICFWLMLSNANIISTHKLVSTHN